MIDEKEVKEMYKAVYELIGQKNYDDALPVISALLENDPNDAAALNFLGVIHLDLQNFHLSYQYFRRGLQESPETAAIWVNFGLSAHELGRNQEALSSYLKSAELDHDYFKAYDNAAALFIEEARWDDAEKMCQLSLEISPEGKLANKNLAHVYLAKHQWVEGWKHWDLSLGGKYRKEWSYGDESRWDGSKDKAVVIFGEQGLGDEIRFASVLPDAIEDCKKVIIDCDPRLEKLFKRSFPKADVHGTRRDDKPKWLKDARIDARCAVSSLPGLYRLKEEDFPGNAYLKADPELVAMFKGMWQGKKAYGLCTHGGSKLTGERWRTLEATDFIPLFNDHPDAVFVSLDYKGTLNNPKIREYKWATQTSDYDLTAALIASLDGVIGVTTTAIHCADGLGVPTHVFAPANHQWHYEMAYGEYVWCKTSKVYTQKEGEPWRDVVRMVQL